MYIYVYVYTYIYSFLNFVLFCFFFFQVNMFQGGFFSHLKPVLSTSDFALIRSLFLNVNYQKPFDLKHAPVNIYFLFLFLFCLDSNLLKLPHTEILKQTTQIKVLKMSTLA